MDRFQIMNGYGLSSLLFPLTGENNQKDLVDAEFWVAGTFQHHA